MKAEIITIGDEILIGQIVDTNSAWLGEQFNLNGIEIDRITSIRDDHDHIIEALDRAEGNADLVVITGGLGPTKDDITKQTLSEYFNTQLVIHEPTLEQIKERFKGRNIDVNQLNQDQALVPENCTVLFNKAGTAPGMWFERNDTIFVSMPGVPFEMKYLTEFEVLPRLRKSKKTKAIYHKTVLTQGVPESMLAEKLEEWENNLPQHIKLAYLPNPMSVRLRLSALGDNSKFLKRSVEEQVEKLRSLIPDNIFGYDTDTLADVIGRELRRRNETLAVAESCTGGYISHLITSVPGSSEYFKGAVTAYSNDVKSGLLNVNSEIINKHGAVSKEVAVEMAEGVKRAMDSHYAVATTGIAGPAGGTREKPVGTIWIAVAGKNRSRVEKYVFGKNRNRNIVRSAQTALQMIRQVIIEEAED